MVFGKPWYDEPFTYNTGEDLHQRYKTDEAFRRLMAHLTSLGACKLILPLALAGFGFGLAGVAGSTSLSHRHYLYIVDKR
jgi:hypothetical protein